MVEEPNDVNKEQVPAEGAPAESSPTNEEVVGETTEPVTEEVDAQGVPLKNRLAESERKLTEANDRLKKIEESYAVPKPQYPVYPQQNYQQPTVQPQQPGTPEQQAQEFVKNPDIYIKNQVDAGIQKIRMQDADTWIRRQDPTNYDRNAQDVVNVIREQGLTQACNADPVGVASHAYDVVQKRRAALHPPAAPAPAEAVKDKEAQRVQKIKKTTTPSGKAAPAQKPNIKGDLYNKALESGKPEDVAKYFEGQNSFKL